MINYWTDARQHGIYLYNRDFYVTLYWFGSKGTWQSDYCLIQGWFDYRTHFTHPLFLAAFQSAGERRPTWDQTLWKTIRYENFDADVPLAQFRRRTFHEPNQIHWIKYMKSSAFESIENGYLNLERPSRSSRLAQPGISALERLWFRRRTFHEPNLMYKLL